jgi:hypothetical protein
MSITGASLELTCQIEEMRSLQHGCLKSPQWQSALYVALVVHVELTAVISLEFRFLQKVAFKYKQSKTERKSEVIKN